MRVLCFFLCAVCICVLGSGAAIGWAQSQAQTKVFVTSSVTNAGSLPADQQREAAAVADQLAFEIARNMDEKYPCAQTLTQSDIATLLGHERQRELLGSGDPDALNRIAGAVGADYFLSATVTVMGPGRYSLNGSLMNEHSVKTEARNGTGPNSGDIVDAIDAFAGQFTASLASLSKFSKDKCSPTNAWIGTIAYTREKHETTHSADSPPMHASRVYDKGESTTENSAKLTVNVNIPWAGPPKARVDAKTMLRTETTRSFRAYCKVPGNWQARTTSSGKTKSVESDEYTAAGEGESRVNAFVDAGKFVLHVNFPQVDGTFIHKSDSVTSGGCPGDKPDDMHASSNGPWKSPNIYPLEAKAPFNQSSDTQTGTFTDAFGGTLSWNLKRTPLKK